MTIFHLPLDRLASQVYFPVGSFHNLTIFREKGGGLSEES